jgi:multicomponent Na+:H+ antiporter subunit E
MTTFIRSLFSLRRVLTIAGLVLAWCALWASFSVANVLSGLAVSLVAMSVGLGGGGRGGMRIVPLAKFLWLVTVDLVFSTATVVGEVLTPTDYTEEGIIAVSVPPASRHHLLMLYVAITVTPGTAVVAAESDGSVLYLHILHRERRADVEAHVHRLAQLAIEALPEPGAASEVRS